MTIIYVDTNIYLDYLLNQNVQNTTAAYRLFERTIDCEFNVLISTKILQELYANIEFDKTKILFELLKPKLITIEVTDEEIQIAKKMDNHYQDALHAMLASKFNADYVVTRNIKHFRKYEKLIKPVLPENI